MDDRSTYPAGLLTFLLGGLAGASIALLFAPQAGRETRRTVGRKVRDGMDAARDLSQRVVTRGRDIRDEASRTLSEALDSAERGAESTLERARRGTDTTL